MKMLAFAVALSLLPAAACAAEELAIGKKAPAFSLVNATDGKNVSFTPGSGRPSVIVFTCNSCPYAKAFEQRIVDLGRKYAGKADFYAINPNDDVKYPEETLAIMKERAAAKNYPFPYLKDGNSRTAGAYGAKVTPHVFIADSSGVVRYRGYVDDSAKPEERSDEGLVKALDAMLAGQPVAKAETKAFGCTIKWKS